MDSNGCKKREDVSLPNVVDYWVLEPGYSKMQAFGVDFFLYATDPAKYDRSVATLNWNEYLLINNTLQEFKFGDNLTFYY